MKRLLISVLLATSMTAASASSPIFEFGAGEAGWFVRNDAVMGGVSSSRLRTDDGVLTFSGRVRLENGGGSSALTSVPSRA